MKLAVLVPLYKQVPSKFLTSLLALQRYLHLSMKTKFAGIFDEFEIVTVDSCFVDVARNNLAKEAIRKKADFCLWIDSDHVFIPVEIEGFVKRYINSDYDIVGAWYNNRTVKSQPVAYNFGDDPDIPIMCNVEKNKVKEHKGYMDVDCVGLGMCIMSTYILLKMKNKHHFIFRCNACDGNIIGEDTYFFFNLKKENKYKIALDCNINVGHIGGII